MYSCLILCCERLNTIPFWPAIGLCLSIMGTGLLVSGFQGISNEIGLIASFDVVPLLALTLTYLLVVQCIEVAVSTFYKAAMHSGSSCMRRIDAAGGCCARFISKVVNYILAFLAWLGVGSFLVITLLSAIICGILYLLESLCQLQVAGEPVALTLAETIDAASAAATEDDLLRIAPTPSLSFLRATNMTYFVSVVCDKGDALIESLVRLLAGSCLMLIGSNMVATSFVTVWEVHNMYARSRRGQPEQGTHSRATVVPYTGPLHLGTKQ